MVLSSHTWLPRQTRIQNLWQEQFWSMIESFTTSYDMTRSLCQPRPDVLSRVCQDFDVKVRRSSRSRQAKRESLDKKKREKSVIPLEFFRLLSFLTNESMMILRKDLLSSLQFPLRDQMRIDSKFVDVEDQSSFSTVRVQRVYLRVTSFGSVILLERKRWTDSFSYFEWKAILCGSTSFRNKLPEKRLSALYFSCDRRWELKMLFNASKTFKKSESSAAQVFVSLLFVSVY